jgi:hypothetical protein
MDENADMAEKINELLGAVAALKAYIAHLPGAADVDLEAVRRAGRDTGAGLIGGVHPSTHVNDAVDDIQRMASALKPNRLRRAIIAIEDRPASPWAPLPDGTGAWCRAIGARSARGACALGPNRLGVRLVSVPKPKRTEQRPFRRDRRW